MLDRALTEAARDGAGRVLALLARRYGDVDLAADAVQDALLAAARTWERDGVPGNPTGWLLVAARRAVVDRLRQQASQRRRAAGAATDPTAAVGEAVRAETGGGEEDAGVGDEEPDDRLLTGGVEIPDERLRLVLLCCHPALHRDAQVALTLRLVLGLTTAEIAAAFLVPEPTLAQRIVRAKRKIAKAGIPLSLPRDLTERVEAVLDVVYLVFTEGHFSAAGDSLVRVDLASEALRLARVVDEILPGRPDVLGLRALLTYHHARRETRVDGDGELVLLDEQDRSRWHRDEIAEGNAVLGRAMRAGPPTRYGLLAAAAGVHANARSPEDTDWTAVCLAYGTLAELDPSPVVALNHAVAVAMRDGPEAGLRRLDALGDAAGRAAGLDRYHAYHVARGELLRRAGRAGEARVEIERGLSLAVNATQRRHLHRVLDRLGEAREDGRGPGTFDPGAADRQPLA